MRFSDCTAWVTGGQRGIGRAFAEKLVDAGCRVVITSRTPDSEAARTAVAELRERARDQARPRPVDVLPWDMCDAESTEAPCATLRTAPPQILVHCAHVFSPHKPIVALKPVELSRGLEANVAAAYALCRAAGRQMARAGFGRILLMGSLAAVTGGVGQTAYIIEKAALEGLARAFAVELGSKGVVVNIAHPAITDTENVRERVDPDIQAGFAQRSVARRLLRPDEVAASCMHLCDPVLSAITGQRVILSAGADTAMGLFSRGPANGQGGGEQP